VLDKKVGDVKYTRYILILPKEVVKESKLLGKEVKASVKDGKIVVEKE
jgi:hypothetical protein